MVKNQCLSVFEHLIAGINLSPGHSTGVNPAPETRFWGSELPRSVITFSSLDQMWQGVAPQMNFLFSCRTPLFVKNLLNFFMHLTDLLDVFWKL
jgi:hypothetical protein